VWSLSWSHPRFGSLLASAGFDKKVYIWREVGKVWEKIYEFTHHNSVNCVTFAPQEYGLILLCGSSDGYVSIHEYKNENWHMHKALAHGFGVTSVSWGPYSDGAYLRFASAGMDNLIRVWQSKNNQIESFYVATTLEGHEDVVKDVSWRQMPSSNYDLIASGGDVSIK
jgi:protein transport protein SEC13